MEENASSIHKSNLLHQISVCLLPVFQYPTFMYFTMPDQAVGEEESTLAPPPQEGVGDGGGGDTSGDGGGGDTSGDGGGNEN
jgi:hypothetical protein